MSCQTKVGLEDSITFSICTHDPDTGVLTDADALPSFRVYEDETAAPVAGGSMAKLDDANSTGLYASKIACTSRNGYNVSKTYTIYIEATVDSDKGGMCYAFVVKPNWHNIILEGVNTHTSEWEQIIGRYRCR